MTPLPLTALAQPLAEAGARDLVARAVVRVWPTERGFDVLSDLQQRLL